MAIAVSVSELEAGMRSPYFCGTPTPTPGMCDILIVYFSMSGEKIKILLLKGAQPCASKIFSVTEIEKSQL